MRSIPSYRNLSGLALALAASVLGAQTAKVVNMIPRSLSNETNCDSEPSIAVNPANILQMAGSAFTPNPAGGSMAPYYVSQDGGNTWTLNAVMPGGVKTHDTSLRFGGSSNVLYAGILRRDNVNLEILRTDGFSLSTPMAILLDRAAGDQPFVDARTVNGADRVYIGSNHFSDGGRTATIDLSTNAATGSGGFSPTVIEQRGTVGQDGPSVRAASAPDGRTYGAFLGWRSQSGSLTFVSDVVVVRDDAGGTGSTKFASLLGSDGLAGVKVATGQVMTFDSRLGSNRLVSSLSIAVDPTDSRTVYVAWGENGTGGGWTLHLRRSVDGGVTWSSDLRTIVGATNPALAINSDGIVGFFYQRLFTGIWHNTIEIVPRSASFTNPYTLVLADLPDVYTGTCGQPTIGDYSGLMAVGADFYGVFSGSNAPRSANFPNGITYQRQANWSNEELLGTNGTTQVARSIDPFFFHIGRIGEPVFTTQPRDRPALVGEAATFTAAATAMGKPAPTYQWQRYVTVQTAGGTRSYWSNISGATSASHTTAPATAADNAAKYRVVASNGFGNPTISSTAVLWVNLAFYFPSFFTQPVNQWANVGQTATFTALAKGNPVPTYQWQRFVIIQTAWGPKSQWSNIEGATSASYTTAPSVAADNGAKFRVIASNGIANPATSDTVVLTVQ